MTTPRAVVVALLAMAVALGLAPPARAAADVEFLSVEATGTISGPLLFRVRFRTNQAIERVELVSSLPLDSTAVLDEAQASEDADGWVATVTREGGDLPNTTYHYRFRVTTEAGEALSDEKTFTVVDERFEWSTLEGEFVRLHWAEGDEAFARRALDIGDEAVAEISALLGVEERDPVDFFVYGDPQAFQEALGPGTREYVAGRAVPQIRTLFALIEPHEIDSDWVEVVVPHELAHLVFHTAVDNPYRSPPHWLNEGLATYLSEDGAAGWTEVLEEGLRSGLVVPLAALTDKFPPSEERFRLGYAEGVSAVDFFVREHGQDALIALVRSYARGLTDDEAFRQATGGDFAAFDAAWMADIGLEAPPTFGPAPAPAAPTTGGRDPGDSGPSAPAADDGPSVPLLAAAAALAAVGLALVVLALRRGGERRI